MDELRGEPEGAGAPRQAARDGQRDQERRFLHGCHVDLKLGDRMGPNLGFPGTGRTAAGGGSEHGADLRRRRRDLEGLGQSENAGGRRDLGFSIEGTAASFGLWELGVGSLGDGKGSR